MSYVDEPAVDSVFLKSKKLKDKAITDMKTKDVNGRTMKMKSACSQRGTGMFIKSELDDKNYVVKGVALIPDVVDGNGEFISEEEIYKAALKFMDFQKVDSQHDFEEGKGDVVFNWILEEEKSFELMQGGSKSYPKGTWIVGTKVKDIKEWEKIKSGERKGFSIAGYWSGVPVTKQLHNDDSNCPTCGASTKSRSPSKEEIIKPEVKPMEDKEIEELVRKVSTEVSTKTLTTFIENSEQEEARLKSESENKQMKEDLATALKANADMLKTMTDLQKTVEDLTKECDDEDKMDEDEEEKMDEDEDEEEKMDEEEDDEDKMDEDEEEKDLEAKMIKSRSILRRATKGKKGNGQKSKKAVMSLKSVADNYKSGLGVTQED